MTWTKDDVEDTIRKRSRELIEQADNARTTRDADALEQQLDYVSYIVGKAHEMRCDPSAIDKWKEVGLSMKMAMARIRGEQERAGR